MKPYVSLLLLMIVTSCGSGCGKENAPAHGRATTSSAVVVEVKSDGFLYVTAPPAMAQSEIDRIVETNEVYRSWMRSQLSNTVTKSENVRLPTRIMISDGFSEHPLPASSGIGMTLLDDRTDEWTSNHTSDGIRQPADGSPKPSR